MRPPRLNTGVVCLFATIAAVILSLQHSSTLVSPDTSEIKPVRELKLGQSENSRMHSPAISEEQTSVSRSNQDLHSDETNIFEAFEQWSNDYIQQQNKSDSAASLSVGESLARIRRTTLAKLIETDPQLALEMAVPPSIRAVLPPSVTQHLEAQITGTGTLEVIASLFDPSGNDKNPRPIERVVEVNERRFKAFVYGRRDVQNSQQSIPLHGIAIENSMAVHEDPVRLLDPSELAAAPAAVESAFCPVSKQAGSPVLIAQAGDKVHYLCDAGHITALNQIYIESEDSADFSGELQSASTDQNPRTQGHKTLLAMRVNFPDDTTDPLPESVAESVMAEVKRFYAASSYGTLNFTTIISPLLTLPKPQSWYMTNDELLVTLPTMLLEARAAAVAAGLPEPDYDLIFVKLGVLSNSRAYVGLSGAWLQTANTTIVCHELGHNLGLRHANAWKTSDGSITGPGRNIEYGNALDTMGSGWGYFNAFYKWWLNWLPESAVQTITQPGIYTVYPSDSDSLLEGATYALRIAKDHARDYWIETKILVDGGLVVNWNPNPGSIGGTQLLDMTPASNSFYDAALSVGEEFYDPALGLKISPLGRSIVDPNAFDVLIARVLPDADLVNVRLNLSKNDYGDSILRIDSPSGTFWKVQATSDFTNWQTIGIATAGEQLTDEGALGSIQRFYRLASY